MPGGRLVSRAAVIAAAVVVGFVVWRWWSPGEETAIRSRLERLRDDINAGVVDGLGTVARAASIGSYFTENVVVDLGQGTAPISGRDTLIGMAARLQPRTAAFRLELADVGVTVGGGNMTADVHLTASFIRRSVSTGEESMDAREFTLAMIKNDGVWRIKTVTAVDTLK